MPATIQKILKPTKYRAVDTSGNNNHGQIYSGRALEFDGVTDYLNAGTNPSLAFENGNHTLAVWFNIAEHSSGNHYILAIGNNATGKQSSIGVKDSTGNLFNSAYSTPIVTTAAAVEINTWYRLVMVYTGNGTDTADFYLNGVFVEQESITLDVEVGKLMIGSHVGVNADFEGMISDCQVWDAVWSASDVLFDYLNPESLALNNGGTSLTESNLKAWYPMQDGHRGQQSYVLDGANTGLGDEMISDGGFESGTDSWGNDDATLSSSDDYAYSGSKSLKIVQSGTSYDLASKSFTTIVGVVYKVDMWLYKNVVEDGAVTWRVGESSSGEQNISNTTMSTYGTWTNVTGYFTATATTTYLVVIPYNGSTTTNTCYVDDVSIKPVNDKHHATTVFFGEEIAVNGDCEVTDPTTVAIGSVVGAVGDATFDDSETVAHAGSKSLKVTGDSSSTYPKITWADGSDMGLVAGRTYYVELWAYIPSGNSLIDTAQLKITDNGGSVVVSSQTTAQDTWTKLFGTFVDDDIQHIKFIGYDASGSAGGAQDFSSEIFYMDDLTVKEVGTATGWTNADQQLDIPQTALQSYNQLAWFDGLGDHVKTDTNPNWADGSWTCSAWVFVGWDTDTDQYIIRAEGTQYALAYIGSNMRPYIKMVDGSGSVYPYSVTTVPFGEWTHLVWSHNDSANTQQIYMNGEKLAMTAGSNTVNVGVDGNETFLGSSSAGATNTGAVDGSINELSIWGKAFSDSEAQELYDDGKPLDATLHSAYIATAGDLKGYWKNNGLATWTDESDNNNHGTPTNITETLLLPAGVDASRDNQGFLMNRQKDTNSLNIPQIVGADTEIGSYAGLGYNPIDTMTKFTVTCWVKPESLKESAYIMSASDSNSLHFGILLHTDGKICMTYENSGVHEDETTATLSVGTWYFLTVIVDNSEGTSHDKIKVYVDDNDQTGNGSTSISNSSAGADNNMYIGTHPDTAYTENFCGQIDDICIYDDKILSYADGEIKRNYNAGKRSHR